MARPYFFVFDGIDGAGKTTQMRRLQEWLESQGQQVETCRDPGTTELGEQIRTLLLQSKEVAIGNHAEMLLYMASRAQLVEEFIDSALQRGVSVISDRFLLANVVYQGHAGGLPPDTVWQVGQVATGGLEPTLTIVLDIDPEVAARRRLGPPDRLERRGLDYFRRVRAGFLAEAARQPDSIAVIDASQPPDEVAQAVQRVARRAIQTSDPGGLA